MIYVFDTSSIRSLQHFYPSVFKTIWDGLDGLVQQQNLISTREVWNELERQNVSTEVLAWAKQNKRMFTTPNAAELQFVAQIFQITHFQNLIGEQQRLKGIRCKLRIYPRHLQSRVSKVYLMELLTIRLGYQKTITKLLVTIKGM
ncbi:MAG TPA: DUF4411 family protein [Gallionella sp.]|nr:DUF4411 family protein [Gallionella sp.]